MPYSIRPFGPADAPVLAQITLSAIRAVGSRRYSQQQVDVWAARHPGAQRFLQRAENGAWIAIAAYIPADDAGFADNSGLPVAYALLDHTEFAGEEPPGGHLDMLYCHPDHTRKGLAERLLGEAESFAKAKGIGRLFTEASELARPAFERAGYKVQHRRDFEVDGVTIHNYAMEKSI